VESLPSCATEKELRCLTYGIHLIQLLSTN
jgi:hypothetical protein